MSRERTLDDAALAAAREAIDVILAAQKPWPAFAVDRHWNIVATNHAMPQLYEGIAAELLAPPMNALRLALHPRGLAPRIENLSGMRAHLLARLRKQVDASQDEGLAALQAELQAYAYPGVDLRAAAAPDHVVMLLRVSGRETGVLLHHHHRVRHAVDATLSELAIELSGRRAVRGGGAGASNPRPVPLLQVRMRLAAVVLPLVAAAALPAPSPAAQSKPSAPSGKVGVVNTAIVMRGTPGPRSRRRRT
jgi:hypothetical protein